MQIVEMTSDTKGFAREATLAEIVNAAKSGSEEAIAELAALSGPAPVLIGLTPDTAEIGSPSFDMILDGEFSGGSVIVFNGGVEPTVYISETQLSTVVDPTTAAVAIAVPVLVRDKWGQESDPIDFTFTEADTLVGDDPGDDTMDGCGTEAGDDSTDGALDFDGQTGDTQHGGAYPERKPFEE